MPDEYITVKEARRHLGVSKMTMARLIREKVIKAEPNPLDRRVKLVRRQDIAKIKNTYPKRQKH